MDLPLVWFCLIGLLWAGYLVLEGFDFGVGALLPVLGRVTTDTDTTGTGTGTGTGDSDGERRRRLMLTTIGPHWDGNEVWLITAGGAMFAAFPEWYATMFSALYLPLLLLLLALILRNIGLEFRHKRGDAAWRARCDTAIIGGSLIAPFLVGVALTNIVRGLPIDQDYEYTGDLATLLNGPSILGGLTVLALSLTHGAVFLALKTTGPIRADARALAIRLGMSAAGLTVTLLTWLGLTQGTATAWVLSGVAALSLVGGIAANVRGREGWAFTGTAVAIGVTAATYFVTLHPNVVPSTLAGGVSLSIDAAASSPLTLTVMTWAAAVFTPVMLGYVGWTYWVFRRRLGTQHLPTPVSVP
ncbi:MAG: cytochrome d ubiquinol oxidase subunit II [Dermatophilaceae bacterium]